MNQEELVYTKLIEKLSKSETNIKLNPANILPTVAQTISLTEKYIKAPGEHKKKIVYSVITKLMENVDIADKEMVTQFLTYTLDSFINTCVSVFNGTYSFKFKHNLKDCFICK
jgi:hypothetical protein